MSLHGGDDGQQPAFQLEDGLEFERLVFLRRVDLSGAWRYSHVVPGVFDLLFGENHAAPVTGAEALWDFDFQVTLEDATEIVDSFALRADQPGGGAGAKDVLGDDSEFRAEESQLERGVMNDQIGGFESFESDFCEIGAIFVSSSEMPPFGSAMLKMRISAFWGSRASEERRILRFLPVRTSAYVSMSTANDDEERSAGGSSEPVNDEPL